MPLAPALPLADLTYLSVRFDGTVVGAADVLYAIDAGLSGGLLIKASVECAVEIGSPPTYYIKMQTAINGVPLGDELRADPGAWIVVASAGLIRIRVLSDAEYAAEFQTSQ